MGKERQSNFELLKIISMLGVIVLHYNHPTIGGAFQYVSFYSTKGMVLYFLECAFVSAVNVFMLISGYFMGGSKSSGLMLLIHLAATCVAICFVCWVAQILFDWITAPLYRWIDQRTKAIIHIENCLQNDAQS
ncbi:MAG: hypothetical protein IKC28_04430 [Clostridia bacterium]|nr:hypothetical protein [Clostridia bacterium]